MNAFEITPLPYFEDKSFNDAILSGAIHLRRQAKILQAFSAATRSLVDFKEPDMLLDIDNPALYAVPTEILVGIGKRKLVTDALGSFSTTLQTQASEYQRRISERSFDLISNNHMFVVTRLEQANICESENLDVEIQEMGEPFASIEASEIQVRFWALSDELMHPSITFTGLKRRRKQSEDYEIRLLDINSNKPLVRIDTI